MTTHTDWIGQPERIVEMGYIRDGVMHGPMFSIGLKDRIETLGGLKTVPTREIVIELKSGDSDLRFGFAPDDLLGLVSKFVNENSSKD